MKQYFRSITVFIVRKEEREDVLDEKKLIILAA
jgi:hypothetical protein